MFQPEISLEQASCFFLFTCVIKEYLEELPGFDSSVGHADRVDFLAARNGFSGDVNDDGVL